MRKLTLMLVGLILLIPVLAANAQAPDAINAALSDLSKRVGHTVAITDLANWSFQQEIFPNAGMGCPQPGAVYAEVQTPGVQFTLVYNGTAYDYRVSADQQRVVLCNSTVATPVPAPCPPPNDPAFLAPRLSVGIQAQVVAGGVPNNIRDVPGTSGKLIGEIPPGQSFTVTDGPRCTTLDKLVWWQVNFNGLTGWTPEGQNGVYWLESLTQTGTPVGTPVGIPFNGPITSTNAAQVALLPDGTSNSVIALSQDGTRLANAAANSIKIVLIGSSQAPVVFTNAALPTTVTVTSLAFDTTGKWLVAGTSDGHILVIDTSAAAGPNLVLTLTGHTGAVDSVAFSADDKLIVSGGDDKSVRVWDSTSGASLAVLSAHQNPVFSVAFSADGSTIISRDNTGMTNLWRVSTGAAG